MEQFSSYTPEQLRAFRRMQNADYLGDIAMSTVTLGLTSPAHASLEAAPNRYTTVESQEITLQELARLRNGVMGHYAVDALRYQQEQLTLAA